MNTLHLQCNRDLQQLPLFLQTMQSNTQTETGIQFAVSGYHLQAAKENVLLRECEGRTKRGLLAKSQQQEGGSTSMQKRDKFHG